MKKNTLLLTVILISPLLSFGQDRHFAWTYESTTLPRGGLDIEPWFTFSSGKNHYYNAYETRLEFEYGLTDHLQTAFYLNATHKAEAITDTENNLLGIAESNDFSFSNEWKVNILNPSANAIGLGLYGEYTLAPKEFELEFKMLLDKRFSRNIIALNLVVEQEWEKEFEQVSNGPGGEIEYEKESSLEEILSYMYLIRPNLGMGLEISNLNSLTSDQDEQYSTLFAGPTLFYSRSINDNGLGYFIIFNVQPQIYNFYGDQKPRDLDHSTKAQARILLGLSF